MINDLKNSFLNVSFMVLIWIVFLISIFNLHEEMVNFLYMWNLIGISVLMGIVFGIAYPYLWNYSTLKVTTKITISTLLNFCCGMGSVYLFSPKVFEFIKPYLLLILVLTLIGHIIGFYFFSKYENKKIADSLNRSLEN
ncbi:hypothetical protein [Lysinibacillus pakistanensis]|uniref:DUF3021 family protein n=1 Tax=Lysinibacillus pakistanensis TaxID=759811 RepID=A0AAX3WXK1_9BACI|nr:hypothetical protein [Lysinibacillus pakistanensis]MDM5230522.1 hypothetical protein [Lysinibacillus pakistanensis]WHY46104.1 hypothetical protein QNH22_23080 [Lysinibacillus pakistanensis]WHY51115.1 hypothetical protein QNH24_23040 [Lysinibacillus pakistanensis]